MSRPAKIPSLRNEIRLSRDRERRTGFRFAAERLQRERDSDFTRYRVMFFFVRTKNDVTSLRPFYARKVDFESSFFPSSEAFRQLNFHTCFFFLLLLLFRKVVENYHFFVFPTSSVRPLLFTDDLVSFNTSFIIMLYVCDIKNFN